MNERPSIWGRVLALTRGEVSAETLQGYWRGGAAVLDLFRAAEGRRAGLAPWAVPPATQAEALCAWNAFALQTLGDQFLEADFVASPATVGYVPRVTAAQILAFYGQVAAWLGRAGQARSDPAYQSDVALPADLPPWAEVEPCPWPHLEAMLGALRGLRQHVDMALSAFDDASLPAERQPAIQRLHALRDEAYAAADYAESIYGPGISRELHEQIERQAKTALERYYHLGQLAAMPRLLDGYGHRPSAPVAAARADGGAAMARRQHAAPGRPGFDPWCLTDPESRERWRRDARAREAVRTLWANDPDPERTLAIQGEIDDAFVHGDIGYATTPEGTRIGHYYCCPWSAVYGVKRPITIGERRLHPLQEFTFDVSAEGMAEGEPFKRELLISQFSPTRRIDYCDLREGGHHDED